MVAATGQSFTIVKADPLQDREEIVNFWNKSFKKWPTAKYAQFYLSCPEGPAHCWVARENSSNSVVAAYALFPRAVWVAGERRLTGICGDMGADPAIRGQGVGRLLQQAAREFFESSDWIMLHGTANPLSRKVLLQEGFRSIGESVRLVRVLRSIDPLKRRAATRLIAPVVAPVIDWSINYNAAERDYASDSTNQLITIQRFDERFDHLFESARTNYALIGERSSKFLNWRFADSPQRAFHIYALERRSDSVLLGYVVLQIRKRIAYIEDIFSLDPAESLRAVLAHLILALKQQEIASITLSYFGGEQFMSVFEQFGFKLREKERAFVLLRKDSSRISSTFEQQENWHFLHADNDVDANP